MRKMNPKRTLNFYYLLCGMTFLTVSSCVYTNNQNQESVISSITNSDKNYKNIEAELLAKFIQQNINLISISKEIQEKEVPFRVKYIAKNIIEEQIEINNTINTITKEKLIIVPNVSNQIVSYTTGDIANRDIRTNYFINVSNILDSQVKNLETLSKTTSDVDFKILALQTLVKLNTTLNKIKEINKTAI